MNHHKKEQNEESMTSEQQAEFEQSACKEEEQKSLDLDKEIEALKKEAKDFKHKYLHLLADAENARKRLSKDRDEIVQRTIRGLILDFLHPVDHMENALKYTEDASDEVKHWAAGFKMILGQFQDVLASNGVKSFDSVGKEFDPHLHHAVEMIETTEYPPGMVVEESIRGYAMGNKPLRPARVKVSKAPEEKETEDNMR